MRTTVLLSLAMLGGCAPVGGSGSAQATLETAPGLSPAEAYAQPIEDGLVRLSLRPVDQSQALQVLTILVDGSTLTTVPYQPNDWPKFKSVDVAIAGTAIFRTGVGVPNPDDGNNPHSGDPHPGPGPTGLPNPDDGNNPHSGDPHPGPGPNGFGF